MAEPMRVRATESGGIVDVKILMKHDMESGQRKDAGGKLVPAWHIQTVTARCKGRDVFQAGFGPAVSRDPFLHFKFKGGARGDKVTIVWVDNRGDTRTDEATIS